VTNYDLCRNSAKILCCMKNALTIRGSLRSPRGRWRLAGGFEPIGNRRKKFVPPWRNEGRMATERAGASESASGRGEGSSREFKPIQTENWNLDIPNTRRPPCLHSTCTLCVPKLYPTPAYANLIKPKTFRAKNTPAIPAPTISLKIVKY